MRHAVREYGLGLLAFEARSRQTDGDTPSASFFTDPRRVESRRERIAHLRGRHAAR